MRHVLKVAAVFLLAPTFVWATPPQCKQDTLTQYIALGSQGCELAGVVYANFTYQGSSTGGAPVIQSGDIEVTPSVVVPSTGNFTFAAPWAVNGGQSQTSKITYSAAIANGQTSSDALSLALGPVQIGAMGSATVTEKTNVGTLQVFESCGEVACQRKGNDNLQFSNALVVLVNEEVDVVGTEGFTALKSYEASLNSCVPCV